MRLLVLSVLAACSQPSKPAASERVEPVDRGEVKPVVEAMPLTSGTRIDAGVPHSDHTAGARHGSHGMALFGKRTYFLDHIPMFEAPHDEQLLLRVRIAANGKPVVDDFSTTAHSIQPTSNFSLDDVALGKLTTFAANVHRGNFEAKGPLVIANAQITVEAVLVARRLPGDEPIAPDMQELFVFGSEPEVYATNVIRQTRGVQQIVRLAETDGLVPSNDRVQRVTVKSATRLTPAPSLRVGTAVETTSKTTFVVGHELWCLQAPQFVEACR